MSSPWQSRSDKVNINKLSKGIWDQQNLKQGQFTVLLHESFLESLSLWIPVSWVLPFLASMVFRETPNPFTVIALLLPLGWKRPLRIILKSLSCRQKWRAQAKDSQLHPFKKEETNPKVRFFFYVLHFMLLIYIHDYLNKIILGFNSNPLLCNIKTTKIVLNFSIQTLKHFRLSSIICTWINCSRNIEKQADISAKIKLIPSSLWQFACFIKICVTSYCQTTKIRMRSFAVIKTITHPLLSHTSNPNKL